MKKRNKSVHTDEFYTMSQIADLLDLNEMTLYRFAKSGELTSHKLGGMMRFRGSDIVGFTKKRRSPSANND